MNWKRMILFSLILWGVTGVAGFLFGFVRGFVQATGGTAPGWLTVGQALVVNVAAICVFIVLARRQHENIWHHALLVVFFSLLLSYLLNVVLGGQPLIAFAGGLVVILIDMAIGVSIGRARSLARSSEPN